MKDIISIFFLLFGKKTTFDIRHIEDQLSFSKGLSYRLEENVFSIKNKNYRISCYKEGAIYKVEYRELLRI